MDKNLGVRVRSEAMTSGGQVRAQLEVVEYLAVENDNDVLVLVEDRLVPVLKVDDRKPSRVKGYAWLEKAAVVVGASMGDRLAHSEKISFFKLSSRLAIEGARYSAHISPAIPLDRL